MNVIEDGETLDSSVETAATRVDAREFQNLSMILYYRLIHCVAYPETIRYGKSDQGLHSLKCFRPVMSFFKWCREASF